MELKMTDSNYDKTHWGKLGKGNQKLSHFDDLLAEQYRRVHLGLLSRWIDINNEQRILKTDLFAEALQPYRAFLWDMIAVDANVIGIDISSSLTARAKRCCKSAILSFSSWLRAFSNSRMIRRWVRDFSVTSFCLRFKLSELT